MGRRMILLRKVDSPISTIGGNNLPELDHKQLTYRFSGRDFRLTDVHGEVIDAILAK